MNIKDNFLSFCEDILYLQCFTSPAFLYAAKFHHGVPLQSLLCQAPMDLQFSC
jgi:hypothetical protein